MFPPNPALNAVKEFYIAAKEVTVRVKKVNQVCHFDKITSHSLGSLARALLMNSKPISGKTQPWCRTVSYDRDERRLPRQERHQDTVLVQGRTSNHFTNIIPARIVRFCAAGSCHRCCCRGHCPCLLPAPHPTTIRPLPPPQQRNSIDRFPLSNLSLFLDAPLPPSPSLSRSAEPPNPIERVLPLVDEFLCNLKS